jgi:hypothetical protein
MSLSTRVIASTPALLAAIAWFAVLLQLWLSIQLATSNGKTLTDGLVAYLGYFTVLTNIFVAVVATAGAIGRGRAARVALYTPAMVGCATTAILLVGIVYHLLLRNVWAPQGAQWLADVLLHYVVPAGALLHWLVYRHQDRLDAWTPVSWSVYPLAYVIYALIRGELLGSYPYPFIDVAALGYVQVLVNTAALWAAFLVLGFAVLGLSRMVRKRPAPSDARSNPS